MCSYLITKNWRGKNGCSRVDFDGSLHCSEGIKPSVQENPIRVEWTTKKLLIFFTQGAEAIFLYIFQDALVRLMGRENFEQYGGHIWQLKFCESFKRS